MQRASVNESFTMRCGRKFDWSHCFCCS